MKLHETEDEIIGFINKFTNNGKRKEVIECFKYGCCYWFAHILRDRFNGNLVYDQVENHFGFKSNCTHEVYDITGNVTNKYNWESWNEVMSNDPALTKRILRDSINFNEIYF